MNESLTESHRIESGVMCEWKDEWNAKSLDEKAALLARQGVRCLELLGFFLMPDIAVVHPQKQLKEIGICTF